MQSSFLKHQNYYFIYPSIYIFALRADIFFSFYPFHCSPCKIQILSDGLT